MLSGVSVQAGPRSVGRHCAAWGLAIARNARDLVAPVLVAVVVSFAVAAAVTVVVLTAQGRFSQPSPVYVPAAFCPAGQRPMSTASGAFACIPDH